MRLLVVGAGAVGGYFGARLLEQGREVTFLVRPRRAALLAEHGLCVQSPLGDVRIVAPPTVSADVLGPRWDAILLSCKAYDLDDVIADIAPAMSAGACILPLLNGLGHLDVLEMRFGQRAVLGGQCVISTTLNDDGGILHLNTVHRLTFGERDGQSSARISGLTELFSGAKFDAVASPTIVQDMWEKWVTLATMAGATCLMRAPLGAINRAAGGRTFILGLLDEIAGIAANNGHTPRVAFMEDTRGFLTDANAEQTSSMYRDIVQGARIEADHIIGDLLRRAQRSGLPHQMLAIVYAHLTAYEQRQSTQQKR